MPSPPSRKSYDDATIVDVVLHGRTEGVPSQTRSRWAREWQDFLTEWRQDPDAQPKTRTAVACLAVASLVPAPSGADLPEVGGSAPRARTRELLTPDAFRQVLAGAAAELLDHEMEQVKKLKPRDRHRFLFGLMDRLAKLQEQDQERQGNGAGGLGTFFNVFGGTVAIQQKVSP